jgi:phospholipase/lecithinase/hemolysin
MAASPYSALYAFGDSLSDAGNDSLLTSATGAEPVSPPYFHTNYSVLDGLGSEAATVFSNGQVWVQDLNEDLGFGFLEPSLLGGNDYAYGGAETGATPQNAGNATVQALSLPDQIAQFNAAQGKIASTALVTISIGGNDIFDILGNPSLSSAQQQTDVADAVANEVADINGLAKDGARNFLLFNVPDLGLVPEVTSGAVDSSAPSAALDSLASSLAQTYNSELATALAGDASGDGGATIDTLNTYALIASAVQDPSAYALSNVTTPVWSGNFTSANSGTLATTDTTTQNTYLFWDDFHPTAGVHQDLANAALAVVTPLASTQASVTGAGGEERVLTFATAAIAAAAQSQLSPVSAAIAAGTTTAEYANQALPSLAAGAAGLADIESGGLVTLPSGYSTAIDLASSPVTVAAGTGNDLVVAGGTSDLEFSAGPGVSTVYAGGGNSLLFGNNASLAVFGGTGSATVVGGQAGNDVVAGSGPMLLFATSGTQFAGGAGSDTVVGGNGPLNATLGGGGGVIYGAPTGGNLLFSGSGPASLVGGGSADTLIASGSSNDLLVAGGGNETLNASGSTGFNVLFGGTGNDSISGGSGPDIISAGTGNETLSGGGGTNVYFFFADPGTSRVDTITDFNPTSNQIGLYGFAPGADAAALASAVTTGGNTTVSLTDGTSIVFLGAPTLHPNNFF